MEVSASTLVLMRLLSIRGVGVGKLRKVIESLQSAADGLANLDPRPLQSQGLLDERQLDEFATSEEKAKRDIEALRSHDVHVIGWFDAAYPEKLRRRRGPPLLMFRGEPALFDRPSIGFCGSRRASDKGLAVARDCAEQLAQAGIDVVSGYASGIDLCTHRTALQAGGSTTIVLPEGLLQFRIKRELKEVWDWTRVCVVSEFSPGARWSVGNAMQRNATICGLSDAMILIEARSTGGSIAAGRESLAMGVPLFVAEYEGMPESADGNRALIAQGAMALRRSRKTYRASLDRVFAAMQSGSGEQVGSGENQATAGASRPRLDEAQTTLFGQ